MQNQSAGGAVQLNDRNENKDVTLRLCAVRIEKKKESTKGPDDDT